MKFHFIVRAIYPWIGKQIFRKLHAGETERAGEKCQEFGSSDRLKLMQLLEHVFWERADRMTVVKALGKLQYWVSYSTTGYSLDRAQRPVGRCNEHIRRYVHRWGIRYMHAFTVYKERLCSICTPFCWFLLFMFLCLPNFIRVFVAQKLLQICNVVFPFLFHKFILEGCLLNFFKSYS